MNAKHSLALACAVALLSTAGLAKGAASQPSPGSDRFHPAGAEQARASGIQVVAKSFGLTPAAAASRLNIEEHAPDIVERIRTQYANRLAGMYIEHAPIHRLVVRLTGFQPVQREFYQFGNDQLVVDYQVRAEHSFADLQKRFERGFAGLKQRLPQLQSGYVDERTGQLVLEVVSDQPKVANARLATADDQAVASKARAAQQQLATNYFGVATRVTSVGRLANQAIKGSGNLDFNTSSQCTAAFTVKSVSTPVTYGLLTAGHCQSASGTYNYTEVGTTSPITTLTFVAAKNDAASDIAWASVSTNPADAVPSFYNGTIFVTRGARITKAGTLIGSSMCHYGRSTVSSASVCGTVQSTAYNPGSICGSSGTGACSAAFVAVDVPVAQACQQIDSGGNWYRGNQPSGIHKAGDVTTGRCVYTSTDDIFGGTLNLQLL